MSVKDHHFTKEWDIVPNDGHYSTTVGEDWNIYFKFWPIYRRYTYPFSYLKLKKIGDEEEDDTILWRDEVSREVVVSRSGTSNYIDWQAEYPTITANLFTIEMGKVIVYTNNVIQCTNPFKMLFRIDNWYGLVTETLGAALKGLIGNISIDLLNRIQSEAGTRSAYNEAMDDVNYGFDELDDQGNVIATHIGINSFGAKLTKPVFKGFQPADADCEALVDSFTKPLIAQKEGQVITITATAKAEAYKTEQEQIVLWRKKYLVDTGLAKVDAEGNITELVPDANARVTAEALKEWANIKGTLAIGGNDVMKMLTLNNQKD